MAKKAKGFGVNNLLKVKEKKDLVDIRRNIKAKRKVDEDRVFRYKKLCFTFGIHC